MKTRTILQAALTLPLLFGFMAAMAGGGNLSGQITDPDTKEPIEGAVVVFEGKGNTAVFNTNQAGYYYASNLAPGTYKMIVSYMSNKVEVGEVKVVEGDEKELSASLGTAVNLPGLEYVGKKSDNPLIDAYRIDQTVLTKKDIKDKPLTKLTEVVGQAPAVVEFEGNYYVHGAREGGLAYYIDGCKIMGNPNIPLSGVELYTVYSNYIPAKYGDANGGVVVVETRNWFTE